MSKNPSWWRRAARLMPPAARRPLGRLAREAGLLAEPPKHPPARPALTLEYPFRGALARGGAKMNYRWGTLCAALHAKTLGIPRISVLEFGVARGSGLLALQDIAEEVEELSGVQIEVYGFDTGRGLTKPLDYRDLPNLWFEGDYKMDEAALRRELQPRTQLVLGPVGETLPRWLAGSPAPVGFVAFDMDLYSSTVDAFGLFEAGEARYLPRVVCYFDDIIAFTHGDFTGERLAIAEFNAAHARRKISQIYGLRYYLNHDRMWTDMMFMFHAFDHPRYNEYDGYNPMREMPVRKRAP